MKHYILLLSTLLSCTVDPQSEMESRVTDILTANMDDPSSFELVSVDGTDSITYNEYTQLNIKVWQESFDLFKDDKSLQMIDSLKSSLSRSDTSDIMEIATWGKFRCKNKFGALVFNDYTITFSKDMEVLVVEID